MFSADNVNPDAIAETARRARAQIEVMSEATTREQADDLFGELLVDLCVWRGRGELDLNMHNRLARETVRAMQRWEQIAEAA